MLGGFVMSLSFIAFVVSMSNTSVANVVFIISTQTMFLALFGYFYLKEKISIKSFFSITLAMIGITIMVEDRFQRDLFWKYCCFSNTNKFFYISNDYKKK